MVFQNSVDGDQWAFELTRQVTSHVRQQLAYYQVSVYKSEIRTDIETAIQKLQARLASLRSEQIDLAFADLHELESQAGNSSECPFSRRVLTLLEALEHLTEADNGATDCTPEPGPGQPFSSKSTHAVW